MVGSADLDAEPVTGWLALNGIRELDGEIARYTLGSGDFEGTLDGTTLLVEAAEVPYEEGGIPEDSLAFSLELTFRKDASIVGQAEGIWSWADANQRCEQPFTATVSGGPDRTPPGAVAWQNESSPVFPFDPITGYLTEPIAHAGVELAVEADTQPLDATLTLVDDHFGRPRAFRVTPAGTWPAGTNLTASLFALTDATGNTSDVVLGPFAIPDVPNSSANPGFELGLENWLRDPMGGGGIPPISAIQGIQVQDENGETFIVDAPEGELMALIDFAGMRLVGHFEPGPSVTRVAVRVGVLDPTPDELKTHGAGFHISVFQNGTLTLLADGSALPDELPDAHGPFSGFVELDLPLPEAADLDCWLVVEAWGFMPPVHLPSLLVDDIRFE